MTAEAPEEVTEQDLRLQVRIGRSLYGWLQDRAERYGELSPALQARTEAELLRSLLAVELRHAGAWTVPELRYMAEAIDGPRLTTRVALTVGSLYASAFELWRINHAREQSLGKALLPRLVDLTPAQDLALHDALSRWWNEELPATAEGFGQVGIRILERAE